MPETREDMASRNTGNHLCADAGSLPALATQARVKELESALRKIVAQYVPDHCADIDLAECHRIAREALRGVS